MAQPLEKGPLVVVAGPPASGKGTLCKRLAARFGAVHFSIGDELRAQMRRGTELGMRAKEWMDRGSFVPDAMALEVVQNRLAQPDTRAHGLLLDGFPRTAGQAEALKEIVDKFVLLEVPDDTSVERALGRRMDPETGAIYHLSFAPPPAEAMPRLVRRDNDTSEAVVRARLVKYREETPRISAIYSGHDVIDASTSAEQVFEAVVAKLSTVFAGRGGDVAAAGDEDDWGDDEVAAKPLALMPKLEVAPSVDVGDDGCQAAVAVTVTLPNDAGARIAADICCVVDISGSMGTKATYETDGVVRSDRLTFLDIVKHAVKTVMHMLKDGDRLALVAFDDEAQTVCALTAMTEEGRASAMEALDGLRPRGQTNLWAGILAGAEALRLGSSDRVARQRTLLVLTDGQPNIIPPKGHVDELRNYRESNPGFRFQINTFGFGYNLDSELLLDLAVEGHGTYAFIPDAVIVGTVFVNSVANALSTYSQGAKLHLTAKGGAELAGPIMGVDADMVTEASWGRVLDLGPLQLGQPRGVVVPVQIPGGGEAYLEVVLAYTVPGGDEHKATAQGSCRSASGSALVASFRGELVDVGKAAIVDAVASRQDSAQEAMQAFAGRLGEAVAACAGEAELSAIKVDVDGRMTKALNGADRFNRWGKHYLRALVRAHQLQVCTNFMDPGLQVYGGELFRTLRAEGDSIFLSLPAPRPASDESGIPCDICRRVIPFSSYAEHIEACANPGRRRAAAPAAPAAPVADDAPDMQTYYQGGGGG